MTLHSPGLNLLLCLQQEGEEAATQLLPQTTQSQLPNPTPSDPLSDPPSDPFSDPLSGPLSGSTPREPSEPSSSERPTSETNKGGPAGDVGSGGSGGSGTEGGVPLAWACSEEALLRLIASRDPTRRGLAGPLAMRLLFQLLHWNPAHRPTPREALRHAYFTLPIERQADRKVSCGPDRTKAGWC